MSYSYYSNFKEFIEGLIKQKKSIGYPYNSSGKILYMFDKYCMKQFPGRKEPDPGCCYGMGVIKRK